MGDLDKTDKKRWKPFTDNLDDTDDYNWLQQLRVMQEYTPDEWRIC